jgi:hypothetical protein
MAHDPLFDSAWLKWAWAVTHADALEADIASFDPNQPPFVTARAEYQAHRHGFSVIIETLPELPAIWSLRLGDIASCYRCALDHLAWAIVSRGNSPPVMLSKKKQRGVHFPIAPGNDEFNGMVSARSRLRKIKPGTPKKKATPNYLPGAKRADIALVRRYQPYNRGPTRARRQCLSVLSRINNDDKHRSVTPVLLLPSQARLVYSDERDCVVTMQKRTRRVPIDVGTEIGKIYARKTGPHPYLKVKVAFSALIGVEDRTPIVLIEWMDLTKAWIESLLREFGDPPVQIHEILPEMTE